MKLKNVPARQGMLWVRAGLRLFGRQPLGFASLFALFGLVGVLLVQIPLVGQIAALALMPLLTMSFMAGTRVALDGKPPHPGLVMPLLRDRDQRRRLLQLGLTYVGGTMLIVALSHVLDGGRFAAAMAALADPKSNPEVVLQAPGLAQSMLMRAGLFALLSVLFWHTPALMCWGRMPLLKAMFTNVVACWRTMGALVLYGATWVALMMVFSAVVQLLFALLGLGQVLAQALIPIALLASTAFYASVYFSFVDTFDLNDTPDAPANEAGIDPKPPA